MKARMPLDRAEGVAQNIRTKARAAHAEKDDVRKAAAEEVELAELARLLEHLVGHVEPAKSVVDLLSLVWIGAPQGGVLRPKRLEEHTSELQSPDHLVCRLLLEK